MNLFSKLEKYKYRYYFNLLIKGSIFFVALLTSVFLFFTFLEYHIWLSTGLRAFLFYSYLFICIVSGYFWVLHHLVPIVIKSRQIDDEIAARNIGQSLPSINDKLLNIIQLKNISHNSLAQASIQQKTSEIQHIDFHKSISFKKSLYFLRILAIPILVALLLMAFRPGAITESTKRIVHYNQKFTPEAPFSFILINNDLKAYKNEDFIIEMSLEGELLPENVYLVTENRRIKLAGQLSDHFTHKVEKLKSNFEFRFEAGGFLSQPYEIEVLQRPNIRNFDVQLKYPAYIHRTDEQYSNTGNFSIPEGTIVTWKVNATETDKMYISFADTTNKISFETSDNQTYTWNKTFRNSTEYSLWLKNQHSANKDLIRYNIDVIKDEYPKIQLEQFRDTVLYNYLIFGGRLSDDYGLTSLMLFYKKSSQSAFASKHINIDHTKTNQSFYYQWIFDELQLQPGENFEYYLEVKDNDGVNGPKVTRTNTYNFALPNQDQIDEILKQSTEKTEKDINENVNEAKSLNEKIEELSEKLKTKTKLDWKDKKEIEDLIKQKEELDKKLAELQKQHENDLKKNENFQDRYSDEVLQKQMQLNQLMQELMDDETKKLMDELSKLLQENANINKIQNELEKLKNKEKNYEKELERTLELFKRLKFEKELESNIDHIEELQKDIEEQNEALDEKNSDPEQLSENQEKLSEDLKDIKEDLNELNKTNQELKAPNSMPDNSEEMENTEKSLDDAQQEMNDKKPSKAQKSNNNAKESLEKMKQKLMSVKDGMNSMAMEQNIEDLRDILDGLITLSFNQEDIMKEFREVHNGDPRFVALSQNQLQLKDDAKIIEDSLYALASRVFAIQSFVTREVSEMNQYMDDVAEAIKQRNKNLIVGKQQFVMTSINNLALMIDQTNEQMQEAMANGMGKSKDGKGKKGGMPDLSQLQQQLNDQIQKLKESGKEGRALSEELARMAAEQEMIRQSLKQLQNELDKQGEGNSGSKSLKDIADKMEQTESDLVNKKITQQTIVRQQQILTRLLEVEKSVREKELDDEREGVRAKQHENDLPKAFEEYIKQKEKEIELLKTIPPKLNPFYKEEVNKYFKKIHTL